jgi:hypothetical protein
MSQIKFSILFIIIEITMIIFANLAYRISIGIGSFEELTGYDFMLIPWCLLFIIIGLILLFIIKSLVSDK